MLATLDVWDRSWPRAGAELLAGRLCLVPRARPARGRGVRAGQRRPGRRRRSPTAASSARTSPSARRSRWTRAACRPGCWRRSAGPGRPSSSAASAWSGRTATTWCCTLGELPAKGYASHGESWSFALALRLACYELLRADGGDGGDGEPVLVLDDVFAELDAGRRERLAELVAGAEQVLVTAAVAARRAGRAGRGPGGRRWPGRCAVSAEPPVGAEPEPGLRPDPRIRPTSGPVDRRTRGRRGRGARGAGPGPGGGRRARGPAGLAGRRSRRRTAAAGRRADSRPAPGRTPATRSWSARAIRRARRRAGWAHRGRRRRRDRPLARGRRRRGGRALRAGELRRRRARWSARTPPPGRPRCGCWCRRCCAGSAEELGEGTVPADRRARPAAPSWKHGPRVARARRAPRDTYG